MRISQKVAVAVTIAGSDSGSGAGFQADLKTFSALRVHGLSVITNITAQSPRGVRAIEPCSPRIVREQLEAVFGEFRPAAVKIGMLYSSEILRTVARILQRTKARNVVIDPVMIATSGRSLLTRDAVKILFEELFPLAALITPNIPEAERLVRRRITTMEQVKEASRDLHEAHGCAVLIKGGHLPGAATAVDVFFDGKREMVLSASRVKGLKTHGTGCTFSAAIAAYLARRHPLAQSVRKAKRYVTKAISHSVKASGHDILGW